VCPTIFQVWPWVLYPVLRVSGFSQNSSSYCAKNTSRSFITWKLGGSLISVPTHLTVWSIHAHLLMETSCSLCCQFSKLVSEFVTHEVILDQLSIPSAVGLT
jgi:hypothetical protein